MNKECQIKYGCYWTNSVLLNAILVMIMGGVIGAIVKAIWSTSFFGLF